jgi:hypothetical protein
MQVDQPNSSSQPRRVFTAPKPPPKFRGAAPGKPKQPPQRNNKQAPEYEKKLTNFVIQVHQEHSGPLAGVPSSKKRTVWRPKNDLVNI